jgi:hypothetical protein
MTGIRNGLHYFVSFILVRMPHQTGSRVAVWGNGSTWWTGGQVEFDLVIKCPLELPDVLSRSVIDSSPLLPTGSVASISPIPALCLQFGT